MDVIITLTLAGADTGPFDLYTSSDGYVTPFASNVPKATLLAGALYSIPSDSVNVKIQSLGMCTTPLMLSVPTTTTTTTSSTTTTTTSTTSSTTSTTTTTTTIFLPPPSMGVSMSITDLTPDNYAITSITFNGGANLLSQPIVGSDPFTQFSLYAPNIGTGTLAVTAIGATPTDNGSIVTIDSNGGYFNTAYTGPNTYSFPGFVINNFVQVLVLYNVVNTTSTTTTAIPTTTTSTTSLTTTTTTALPCTLSVGSFDCTVVGDSLAVHVVFSGVTGTVGYLLRLFKDTYTFIDQVTGTTVSEFTETFTGLAPGNYNTILYYTDDVCQTAQYGLCGGTV